jgi:hypothetical protein
LNKNNKKNMATETQKSAPVVEKLNDTQIKITRTVTIVESQPLVFTKDGLIEQRENIVKQRTAEITRMDAELEEIDSYLAEAEKAGIKTAAEVEADRQAETNPVVPVDPIEP